MVHILSSTCSPWAPNLDLIVLNFAPASLVVLQQNLQFSGKVHWSHLTTGGGICSPR